MTIHVWAISASGVNGVKQHEELNQFALAQFPAPPLEKFASKAKACAKVCAEWGVKMGLTLMEDPVAWIRQHLQPDDLLMVTRAAQGTERRTLIRQVLQETNAAVLVCPETWRSSLSRILVLYRSCEQNQRALAAVMELCRYVRSDPVILTVARTEREGNRLQRPARAAFAEHGQSGNFDLLIGADVAEGAARVARWRQCQLLVMGRYGRPPWMHWLGGSTTEELLDLTDSLAVLTIPPAGGLDLRSKPRALAPPHGQAFRLREEVRAPERKVGGV